LDETQQESSKSPDELLQELIGRIPLLQAGERSLVVEISNGKIRRRRITLGPLSGNELEQLERWRGS
jgi:hypothetical protein